MTEDVSDIIQSILDVSKSTTQKTKNKSTKIFYVTLIKKL